MEHSTEVESAFSNEIIRRFREQLQAQEWLFRAIESYPLWFDARCGALVMECPNLFLVKAIESLQSEMDAIAHSLGLQMQIVVSHEEKQYW